MSQTITMYDTKGKLREVQFEDKEYLDLLPELKHRKANDDENEGEHLHGALLDAPADMTAEFTRLTKSFVSVKVPIVHMARPLFGPSDPRHSKPGVDIIALKRGLWRMGLFAGPAKYFDANFNDKLEVSVRKAQRKAKLYPTGNVGWPTFDFIRHSYAENAPKEFAFDALAIHLADQAWQARQVTPLQRVQNVGLEAAAFWVAHKDESSYAQVRPMQLGKPPFVPRRMDCSWFTTIDHFAAGAPDPNGLHYNGQGYTGTQYDHCMHVGTGEIQPLDLVFYGFTTHPSGAFPYGSPTHVALYIGGGFVASDGSNSGPEKRAINYRPINGVRRNRLVV